MNDENIIKVLEENKYLIYSIIKKYSLYYNIEDLYQVGVIGLIKAYKKYDIKSNTKFSSYAYKYILGEIITFIKNDRNIQVSDEMFSLYKKYLKVKELLLNKFEREANIEEISNFMNIESSKLIHIIESVSFTKSIESEEIYSCDNREILDLKILLNNEISLLDNLHKKIIEYRYYQGYNQNETAELLGISQSTVSREEKLVLKQLKNNLN